MSKFCSHYEYPKSSHDILDIIFMNKQMSNIWDFFEKDNIWYLRDFFINIKKIMEYSKFLWEIKYNIDVFIIFLWTLKSCGIFFNEIYNLSSDSFIRFKNILLTYIHI